MEGTEPAGGRLPYSRALDGLRGLAVAVVLLFHADVPQVTGGHLGVTAFFTLSGFLITALLLTERHGTGRIHLPSFWARRARRLVPAMLVCFLLVAVVVYVSDTAPAEGLVWDAVASAMWAANWRFVLDHQSYGDLFALPSPFQHFWSLAVEEQFYVVFPLVVVVLLGVRAARPRIGRLTLLLVGLIALSTWQSARLYTDGAGLGHAYYGTDARMAELLVGALLAVLLVRAGGVITLSGWRARGVQALGGLGLVGLLVACATVEKGSAVLYRGGFLAVALCTAAVIAAVMQPASPVGRLLGLRPLVLLGLISYGAYLYHWPLFLLLTESQTGASPAVLFAMRMTATLSLATLSLVLLERPVRRGALPAAPALVAWGSGLVAGLASVALVAGSLVAPVAETTIAGAEEEAILALPPPESAAPIVTAGPSPRASAVASPSRAGATASAARPRSRVVAAPALPKPPPRKRAPRKKQAVPQQFTQDPQESRVPPVPARVEGNLRVVMVGDSIGDNLGWALRVWAKDRPDVTAYNLAVPACPVSRGGDRRLDPEHPFPVDPTCGWWDDPSSERYKAFQQFDPDVVVVQDSVNEVFDRKLSSWSDWQGPGDTQFDEWLIDEYQTAVDRWTAGGAKVLMTNALCGDWQRYEHFKGLQNPERRVSALNNIVYPRLRDVRTADIFDRVCPGGQYSDEVEGYPDGRPDGFHFAMQASPLITRRWLGPLVLDVAGRESTAPAPAASPSPY